MESLFEKSTQQAITQRLQNLNANSKRAWGTMTVSQMLKHLEIAFAVPINKVSLPKENLQFLVANPLMRKLVIDVFPWPKNMMTAKDFVVKSDPEFEQAKQSFLEVYNQFIEAKTLTGSHPIFGEMDKDTWGRAMYKHLDHHLRQFGV